jgi:ParB/RepB/Spo0J family partition protein
MTNTSADNKRHLIMVMLSDITPSATNPRKTFPETEQAELVESIREHGVLQPLLLRPSHQELDDTQRYELVAGERRYRAARSLFMDEVPCMIANLTDREVLEIQIIENLQRRDLDELEEAEGYQLMVERHGYTADELADKIGKSKAYIYARLKLCDLTAKARDALRAGQLTASTALLVARIPVPSLQDRATKELSSDNATGEPMSARRAASHIQSRYTLRMETATWPLDDTDLIAPAGACNTCPKRTSVNRELFADVDADVCTDPDCFAGKKLARRVQRIRIVEVQGGQFFDRKTASTITNNDNYIQLDEPAYELHDDDSDEEIKTYREILAEQGQSTELPITLVEDSRENLREYTTKEAIDAALKAAGSDHNISQLDSEKNTAWQKEKEERDAKNAARQEEQDRRTALRTNLRAALRLHFDNDGTADLANDVAMMCKSLLKMLIEYGDNEALDTYWNIGIEQDDDSSETARMQALHDRVDSMTLSQSYVLLMDICLEYSLQFSGFNLDQPAAPELYALLKRYTPVAIAEQKQLPPTPAAQAKGPAARAKKVKTVVPTLDEWPFPSAPNSASTAAQASDTTPIKAADAAKEKPKAKAKPKPKQSSRAAAGGKGKTTPKPTTDDDATVERCQNTIDMLEAGQQPAEGETVCAS